MEDASVGFHAGKDHDSLGSFSDHFGEVDIEGVRSAGVVLQDVTEVVIGGEGAESWGDSGDVCGSWFFVYGGDFAEDVACIEVVEGDFSSVE